MLTQVKISVALSILLPFIKEMAAYLSAYKIDACYLLVMTRYFLPISYGGQHLERLVMAHKIFIQRRR